MSDSVKVILAIILVVLVIILCATTLSSNNEVNDDFSNNVFDTENTTINENNVNENEYNNEEKDEVENTTVRNIIENEIILDTMVNSNTQNNVYESQTDIGSTDKKQQAINLVKEKWGEDDTVTFRCDNISNGEYIVAVVSIQTASVQNYFRVNLENQTVTIDY